MQVTVSADATQTENLHCLRASAFAWAVTGHCGFGRGHDDGWARESPARTAASTTRA